MAKAPDLSKALRLEYAHDVGVIQRGQGTLIDIAKAVRRIRSKETWKLHYPTWDDFCRAEFSKSGRWATSLASDLPLLEALKDKSKAGSSDVAKNTRATQINTKARRAMNEVPKESRDAVLESANDAADRDGSDVMTDKHVAQGVRDVLKPPVKDMEGNRLMKKMMKPRIFG